MLIPAAATAAFVPWQRSILVVGSIMKRSCEEVVAQVREMETDRIEALFLMTTADFSQQKFLEIGRAVRGGAG